MILPRERKSCTDLKVITLQRQAEKEHTRPTKELLRILKTTKMTRRAWCQQNLNRALGRMLNAIRESKIN